MKETDKNEHLIQQLPEKAAPFMEEQEAAGPAIAASIGGLHELAPAQAAKWNA
ncbi:hypothetical protein ACLBWT_08185 [Paenibacillus sp. D51F]